ncbi:MAG TPA: MarR family transcriptional regulator [Candidatus Dormibacteraeota bacterium]|nr:MarR family transcriptional regulator [Candidatus Dormibacteraeota bacterium]
MIRVPAAGLLDPPPTRPLADEGPVAELEQAVTVIIRWSSSREVQLETMGRARCDLPVASVSMLQRIAICGPVHPSQLAAYYGVDNSTITPRLQRLERAGLLTREADPRDGRAALVRITPAGQRLRKRLHLARRQMLQELVQDWPLSEQIRVAAATTRLAERLELLTKRLPRPRVLGRPGKLPDRDRQHHHGGHGD